jgi:hypothetical protein
MSATLSNLDWRELESRFLQHLRVPGPGVELWLYSHNPSLFPLCGLCHTFWLTSLANRRNLLKLTTSNEARWRALIVRHSSFTSRLFLLRTSSGLYSFGQHYDHSEESVWPKTSSQPPPSVSRTSAHTPLQGVELGNISFILRSQNATPHAQIIPRLHTNHIPDFPLLPFISKNFQILKPWGGGVWFGVITSCLSFSWNRLWTHILGENFIPCANQNSNLGAELFVLLRGHRIDQVCLSWVMFIVNLCISSFGSRLSVVMYEIKFRKSKIVFIYLLFFYRLCQSFI